MAIAMTTKVEVIYLYLSLSVTVSFPILSSAWTDQVWNMRAAQWHDGNINYATQSMY